MSRTESSGCILSRRAAHYFRFLLAMIFMAYVYFENLAPTPRVVDSSTVVNTSSNVKATREQFVMQKEVKYFDKLNLVIVAYSKSSVLRMMASEANLARTELLTSSVAITIENMLLSTAGYM
jgi:hypothetical protein